MANLPSNARVVIVGGGMFGVSILYHLAKEGWKDVVLIEKGELTSGSTWHAAGQCPHFIGSINMARIHHYGTQLYASLEAETGQATSWHGCGGIRLALTDEEIDMFHHVRGVLKLVGAEMDVIPAEEIRQHHPHLETFGVKAGALTYTDGHVDPTSAANAMAAGARDMGAKIFRRTRVTDTKQLPTGEWKVFTEGGEITCEHLVNAAGSYAAQVAEWVGLNVPIVNMLHQYIVTEALDEIKALDKELPVVRDPYCDAYLRQEQKGLLIGPYETSGARVCFEDGVPWDFDMELLPPEIERLEPWLEKCAERMPLFGKAGIKSIVSGAITHTPDGNFLLGPAGGLRNYWMAAGASIGIAQGAGAGKYLAQWMAHGQAEINMLEFDPRRFGDWADAEYTKVTAIDEYQNMYICYPPGKYREEGRPVKKTPLHDEQARRGAQFGPAFGWERPRYFDKSGKGEEFSFRRSNAFDHVREECRAVRERVGILELSGFAKFDVTGPDAQAFLDRCFANRVPRGDGRLGLCHWLTEDGAIEGEATITRFGQEHYYLASGAVAEIRDGDMLRFRKLDSENVEIKTISMDYGVLVLSGPKSRDAMSAVTDADLSNEAFPWLSARMIDVAGVPCRALRVSYVGELGWELHCPMERLADLYHALWTAGEPHGIADFGVYAMNSLRIEKAYKGWGGELTNELSPFEAGLERFVKFDKDYVGREALDRRKDRPLPYKLVYMEVEEGDSEVLGNEPVLVNGDIVGLTTSGGYGFAVGKSLAFAYVKPDLTDPGQSFEIEMQGARRKATAIREPAYDPDNERLRA